MDTRARPHRTAKDLGLAEFSNDPVQRLRHTLTAFQGQPDDMPALTATRNAIHPLPWTGVTWGDLRDLIALIDEKGL